MQIADMGKFCMQLEILYEKQQSAHFMNVCLCVQWIQVQNNMKVSIWWFISKCNYSSK